MRQLVVFGLVMIALMSLARAETHVVRMMNQGPNGERMVFQPNLLRIAAGDTVRFVPVDRGHNVASIDGMMPAGATPWMGKISHGLEVTLTVPGVYGFRCIPHYAMGMVGLIVVDDPAGNLETARARPHSGKAKLAFARLFARLEEGAARE